MGYFDNCRLARMSDGHYCFVRDLGPVKGGKGMKHHEVVVDFTFRGILQVLKRVRPKHHALLSVLHSISKPRSWL
jgi:hypothetical protein